MTDRSRAFVTAAGPTKVHALRVGDPYTPCGMWAPIGEDEPFDPDDMLSCAKCVRAVQLSLTAPNSEEVDVTDQSRAYVPDGMTPDKLRYIAKTLDLTQGILAQLLREGLLRVNDEPLAPDAIARLADWAEGTEQQDDLRQWADSIEASPTGPDQALQVYSCLEPDPHDPHDYWFGGSEHSLCPGVLTGPSVTPNTTNQPPTGDTT